MTDAMRHAPATGRASTRRAFAVMGPQTLRMRAGDGVELATDIYRPDAPGKFPALVMRQPYGRRIASTVVLAHPAWYAARGYIVAVQDVRGRGDSGGRFRILEDDIADGAAALAWAADLPGCDGKVATYGFSYQAMTQLMALAGAMKAGTKTPDAMAPAMGAWSVRDDWAYEGNAFRLALNLGWACQMGAEQARLGRDRAAYDVLAAAARGSPWLDGAPGLPAALQTIGGYAPHYLAWLSDDAAAFERMSPDAAFRGLAPRVPALCVGGWQDFMLEGTLKTHAAFRSAAPDEQRLVIGPWAHIPWGRSLGLDLGDAAASPVDEETVRFFDLHLRDEGVPDAPVRLFDVIGRRWRDFQSFPAPSPRAFYLASSGRAATTTTDGAMGEAPRATGEDRFVHDPWRPAPAVGGALGQPPGYQDRAALDDRADVAVYTSAPLPRALDLCGRVAADLHADADMVSHDLHCALSFLPPGESRAMTLTSGHLRVADSAASAVRHVPMRAICASLPQGARVRLSVQAAAFPAYAVNPGTGARPDETHPADARVTTITLRHGVDAPSRLLLPVLA